MFGAVRVLPPSVLGILGMQHVLLFVFLFDCFLIHVYWRLLSLRTVLYAFPFPFFGSFFRDSQIPPVFRNRGLMQAVANFSMPIISAVDRLVGSKNAMRLDASSGEQRLTLRVSHADLEDCVGLATAAFGLEVLQQKAGCEPRGRPSSVRPPFLGWGFFGGNHGKDGCFGAFQGVMREDQESKARVDIHRPFCGTSLILPGLAGYVRSVSETRRPQMGPSSKRHRCRQACGSLRR